ncbi:hypothetical protein JW992_15120 [candidate division KSB1 bacterium]|nr:hypothetical protein [candidate division KSB1 bacterium]
MKKNRRKNVFRLISLVFGILPAALQGQTVGKIEGISLYEKDLVIRGENRRGPYFLPDTLIIAGSEKVYIDGVRLPESGYQLNAMDGELRFQQIISDRSEIRIIYSRSPVELKKSYFRNPLVQRVVGAPTQAPLYRGNRPVTAETDYASQLNKSGSITRGVTVGNNRGLKLNSSLNLNLSGKIADQVQVTAALTDQSTPIQPEGTTQNLQEIDKVFVRVQAPHFKATLGDYILDLQESEFARYNRKLQGAMGEVENERFSLLVSGAVSKGKFISKRLTGREGFQGPYQLTGDQGQLDIIVLAGTERVYIDGESLVRGETNDYIIDYAAAQITFTRKRLITSDSRIVVDYQYSDERFRRNLYSAQLQSDLWRDRLQFSATFLHEADDRDNPLDFALSEERLGILEQAGDDPDRAIVDGAVFVGFGVGRYTRSEEGFYVFVGPDSGDYQVTFSDLGTGKGSYRYKGDGAYEYVGEQQGRYAPVLLLSTAKSQDVLDFTATLQPMRAVRLSSETAVSRFDRNTYSALDDDDNQGVAQTWTIRIEPDSMRLGGIALGALRLTGRLRNVDNRFQDIDRTTSIEYNRQWDLPDESGRGESVRELQIDYQARPGWQVGGDYGKIEKNDGFFSKRWQVDGKISSQGLPQSHYRVEQIRSTTGAQNRQGNWSRQKGGIRYRMWKVTPFFEYEKEIKKENWSDSLYTGFRFDETTGGLDFSSGSRLSATAQVRWRQDDDYRGPEIFDKRSDAVTQSLQVRLQQSASLSASAAFTHRERRYADANLADTRSDLAELQVVFSPWRRALSGDINYQISNTATARKEKIYIRVSQGDGNYRFDADLNEYVIDPLGDYILRILTTDEFIPVVKLKASSRLRLDPGQLYKERIRKNTATRWQRALAAVVSESYAAVEENSQEPDVWAIYLFDFSKYRQSQSTVYGTLNIRQDVHLFETNRDFTVRLRHQRSDELSNQYLEGGQSRLERENSLQLVSRLSNRTSLKSNLAFGRIRRAFQFAGQQDRDIHATEWENALSFRPTPPLELALEARVSLEEDRAYAEPTRIRAFALGPRLTYSLQGKGRFRSELEWSQVNAQPQQRNIPFEMAKGRSLGTSMRWDFRFDYRISQTINATVSYTGRYEPQRERTIHTGQAQVTAAFR